ncbi:hypothetical protein HY338_03630 [Candidatus Gottesmanbacteria bacterium]|nr:hypothetical protein [Candidatus Gottesmanbacteria bacterium]
MLEVVNLVALDLDGVVTARGLTRQYKAERDLRNSGPVIFEAPTLVSPHPQTIYPGGLKAGEIFSFIGHMPRRITSETSAVIGKAYARGVIFNVNSGRKVTRPWADMTDKLLERGGIKRFIKTVYLRPPGWETGVSKIAGIEAMRSPYAQEGRTVRLFVFEDNFREGAQIAQYFPKAKVVLVRDHSTEMLRAAFGKDLDNIVYADSFHEGMRKYVIDD